MQYAHARTHNVARNAAASGVDRSEFAPELLDHETESALLGALQEFPRIVAFAAEVREPHRVARYLEELAGLYHRWYDNCRVIPLGDEPVGRRAPHAAAGSTTPPARCCATGWTCSASTRPNGCRTMMTAAGDTQPTQPLPELVRPAEPAPRKRRRVWPWIVALSS